MKEMYFQRTFDLLKNLLPAFSATIYSLRILKSKISLNFFPFSATDNGEQKYGTLFTSSMTSSSKSSVTACVTNSWFLNALLLFLNSQGGGVVTKSILYPASITFNTEGGALITSLQYGNADFNWSNIIGFPLPHIQNSF